MSRQKGDEGASVCHIVVHSSVCSVAYYADPEMDGLMENGMNCE